MREGNGTTPRLIWHPESDSAHRLCWGRWEPRAGRTKAVMIAVAGKNISIVTLVDPSSVFSTRPTRMAENDSPPLGKFLASSGWTFIFLECSCAHCCEEKATRDRAVKNLVRFLSHSEANVLSNDLELAKLWKGIFYCTSTRLLSPDHPQWCLSCLGRRLLDVRQATRPAGLGYGARRHPPQDPRPVLFSPLPQGLLANHRPRMARHRPP